MEPSVFALYVLKVNVVHILFSFTIHPIPSLLCTDMYRYLCLSSCWFEHCFNVFRSVISCPVYFLSPVLSSCFIYIIYVIIKIFINIKKQNSHRLENGKSFYYLAMFVFKIVR